MSARSVGNCYMTPTFLDTGHGRGNTCSSQRTPSQATILDTAGNSKMQDTAGYTAGRCQVLERLMTGILLTYNKELPDI